MRDVCNKLPKTASGQPAFEKGENIVRWQFYKAMLFMKDQFVGREMQGAFHDRSSASASVEEIAAVNDGDEATTSGCFVDVMKREESAETEPYSNGPTERAQPEISSDRPTKRTRLDDEFLKLEREQLFNLKTILSGSQEPREDEWSAFCEAISHDLRKLKDIGLVMKAKADIRRVVTEAVWCQLQLNDSNAGLASTSPANSSILVPQPHTTTSTPNSSVDLLPPDFKDTFHDQLVDP